MRLIRWLPGRLLSALAVLTGASILIFGALRSLPGDFTLLLVGPLGSEELRQQIIENFGLDRSLIEQYFLWLAALFRGDLGVSVVTQQPVVDEFMRRVPVTAILATMSIALTVAIGIPLGTYAGTSATTGRRSVSGRLVSSIGISIPEIVFGSVVVYLFSRYSLGLTVAGFTSPVDDFGRGIVSLLLPCVVLSLFTIAATGRITRDAVLDVLVEPHIAAAVARGEPARFIVRHHVLRNALIPVVTLTATIFAYLLGGTVIVESIFDIPGLGSYLIAALVRRDYAVMQAGVLLVTAFFVTVSLAIDIVTGIVDPRVSVLRERRAS